MDGVTPTRASYIVKLADDCNLACPYCYYFSRTPRLRKSRMSFDLVSELISQAAELSSRVEFIWHGGEPLLAGQDTFQAIVELQHNISKQTGVEFRNCVQTNATLLHEQWCSFFRREGFQVGVSLDGPQWLHDLNRSYVSGKSSFERTLRGIRLLQDAEVSFGVLAVVSKPSLEHAREIYEFFLNNNITAFDFLPCAEVIRTEQGKVSYLPNSLEPGDFASFLVEIFDLWFAADNPAISIRYLENVLVGLLGGNPSGCTFNRLCKDYVCVQHDGTVLPCDNFVGYGELVFGNMGNSNLGELLVGQKRTTFQSAVSNVRQECAQCKYFYACGGGCSKYSYMLSRSFTTPNFFCGDRWLIFEHVSQRLIGEHPSLHIQ